VIGNRKLTVGDAVRLARSQGVLHQEDSSAAPFLFSIARRASAEYRMRGFGVATLAEKWPGAGAISLLSLEALARKMYETTLPGSTPWPRCGWDVRRAWLSQAKQARATAGPVLTRFPFWREIKSWLRPSEPDGA
jgi:hypothetical protein